ncbi:MAG: DNA polymerase III subunit beta [Leptospiraceae bacterium]|nr:DNA polymerase III subunit beta [Leptospiraceae bacterium]MCP5493332.1 DNA polymerase III subunit beta [Leptospiraceae bacterium]
MKFVVKTTDFQKAISSVEGVITVREINSILSKIKVEVDDSKVYLSATDLEISIKTSVEAEAISKGNISLPARQLSSTFKLLNFANTLVENDENNPTISIITDAEKKVDYRMNINGMEGDEIKTIAKVDTEETVEFPCEILAEMIKKTFYSVAVEDTRFVFNGLFISNDGDKVSCVGTDGRRLSKVDRVFPTTLPFSEGVIIPHKAIKEISKMIETSENGRIGLVDKQIYLSNESIELQCKLIDGTYPDYESVIPKSSNYSVRVPREEFQVALRQAISVAEEPSRQIRLKFSNNQLNLNASTPGSTEVNININIDYQDEDIVIAFKGDYLVDVLKSIDNPEVIIEFSNQNAPAVFKDPNDEQFVSVIMPMKIQ